MNRFRTNPLGIKKVGQGRELADELHDDAEKIADEVRRVAPVLTGAYRDSIRVEDSEQDGTVVSHVVADVPYAGILEFGTSDTPTFAPLRRGAEGAGFRLRA